jgi:hypothetical protein
MTRQILPKKAILRVKKCDPVVQSRGGHRDMAQISSFWDPGGQGTELNVARVQYSTQDTLRTSELDKLDSLHLKRIDFKKG